MKKLGKAIKFKKGWKMLLFSILAYVVYDPRFFFYMVWVLNVHD